MGHKSTEPHNRLTRRGVIGAAGVGLAAAMVQSSTAAVSTEATAKKVQTLVHGDGSYETVPLVKDTFTLGIAQSRVIPIDLKNLKQSRKANLDHMLHLIDAAGRGIFGKPDLLFFHEFPITGWDVWNREEVLRLAIDIPGEETMAIGRKAKEHGMYIVFGSYARDPDWPGHALSITTVIGPDGEIVSRDWKSRNVKGLFGKVELFTTTVYDVLDEFIEMYGADAVIPVVRTPIGNFFMSSTQHEPEIYRAAALKGAEVILRTATGGFQPVDIQATALYNRVYTAICNNSISPDGLYFEDTGAGGSAIYGPGGETLGEAKGQNETLVMARIPIAQFRKTHKQPTLHKELYMPEYEQYVTPYAPNLFQDYQPDSLEDAASFVRGKRRWK